ncbi:MAG TPA: ring-cleaving dioxygenase [Candidatus Sulfomarinibacteraceae bacterium]|nr:ring-cleaving dioxygenase [Candidatus Sulfomarinibacteraceae bacterium]
MEAQLGGIHHITAIAGDPQRNLDFYTQVLGLRMVKLTVNFDDPGTYHFYFGDRAGAPGTILTFFPWAGARRGQRGNGQVATTAFSVPAGSLDYWQERLAQHDVAVAERVQRFGEEVLPFRDPDGLHLELVADEAAAGDPWTEGPAPADHAIRSFHHATLWEADVEPTAVLLTEAMGFELAGQDGDRFRFRAAEGPAGVVDILRRSGEPSGRMGAGIVHHIAYRTASDEEQQAWRERLLAQGQQVTPVRDRQYFRSIYFREPGGVLFEIATDLPGFATDEALEELGMELKLPPWLEPRRAELEQVLPRLERN